MDPAFAQFGAIGIFAALATAAVRVLFARQVENYKREQERGDRLEQELLRLNEAVRGQYLTTIGDATRAIGDAISAVRKAP